MSFHQENSSLNRPNRLVRGWFNVNENTTILRHNYGYYIIFLTLYYMYASKFYTLELEDIFFFILDLQ